MYLPWWHNHEGAAKGVYDRIVGTVDVAVRDGKREHRPARLSGLRSYESDLPFPRRLRRAVGLGLASDQIDR